MNAADIYQDSRRRVTALVSDADPGSPVAACPGWTLHDVVAHLAGLAADWRRGNLAGYATEPWTAAQVESRRDAALDDMLDEWEGHADAIAPALADPGPPACPPTCR